ncbi:uncharacterized protein LOC117322473 [Pecten maximus]|uniref:uncharacterized protein LOC117322473 n=1 Tax=Pecten maximus TaxID=6579 RepID=UPI00145829CF|nr:uncharacterized protein LOC117322473 [Pecten maximus]
MHGTPGQLDANNMRDFVQKNSLERVAHEKRTKTIEHQKKVFVRQYSKDEQEVKDILQRLHVEQLIYDVDYLPTDAVRNDLEEEEGDIEEEEVFVNPYPITIIPKFGQTTVKPGSTPKKGIGDTDPQRYRSGRRKSLEFEDIPTLGCSGSAKQGQHGRPSVTGVSTPAGRTRKLSSTSDQQEIADIWVGDPEFISSVRRPRKTSSDINHRKLLQRAMSDVWVQSNTESLSRLSTFARKCSADELHKDISSTSIISKKEKISGSLKSNNDEINAGAQDGAVNSSPDRVRKLSVNKDAHALHLKDETKSTNSDNKSYLNRSDKKSSFKKPSKSESEMKAILVTDGGDAEGKENDIGRSGKSSLDGTSRVRKLGRVETDTPDVDLTEVNTDKNTGPQARKRVLKKKRSMPEMKIGSPSTMSLDESSPDTRPRARHGSLKEKTEIKSRPRNSSFN